MHGPGSVASCCSSLLFGNQTVLNRRERRGDTSADTNGAQQDPYNRIVPEIMRDYLATHPWIDFKFDLRKLEWLTYFRAGEAMSKCEHIAGAALMPEVSSQLHLIYLVKGVLATTAIEGNTMSEEQVRARIEGDGTLPPSREYQGIAVDNIVDVSNEILAAVAEGASPGLSPELLKDYNRRVLEGQELEDGVAPGEVRKGSVGVGRYLAPPAQDCEYLVEELCNWINRPWIDDGKTPSEELKFTVVVLKAVLAHLYIAWIHPFGDGNGRTARLVEHLLLVSSGVPSPAAHLLSNHYNLTRDRYYLRLDESSKGANGEAHFVDYAIEGFVDGLREQIDLIRRQQMEVTWVNYVHSQFEGRRMTETQRRRRALVLAMTAGEVVPREAIAELSPAIARLYATVGSKTITRDLNALVKARLLKQVQGGFEPHTDVIEAFLPMRMPLDETAAAG